MIELWKNHLSHLSTLDNKIIPKLLKLYHKGPKHWHVSLIMSYQPFEIYLFENASSLSSKRYQFSDRVKEILTKKDDLETCLQNGIRYLESTCTLLFGYTSECIGTGEKVMKNIPVLFDSALILFLILDTGISMDIIFSLQSLIKNNQNESGFWTYFLRKKSRDYDILPDDIDDTSVALMSLFSGKAISKEECIQVSEKMRQHFLYSMNGQVGTYLKPTSKSGKVLWTHYTESARVDIGCCLNLFWLFGSLGLDHILNEPEFQPTINLLVGALEEIERDEKAISSTISYSNPNILLYFFSRFVMVSKFGETRFKDKLVKIIKKKIESNHKDDNGADKIEGRNETVIDLACQIMMAINMNLHNDQKPNQIKTYILLKMRKMLAMKLPDGSFPRAPMYDWKPYKAVTASKAISTAFVVAAIKMVLDL